MAQKTKKPPSNEAKPKKHSTPNLAYFAAAVAVALVALLVAATHAIQKARKIRKKINKQRKLQNLPPLEQVQRQHAWVLEERTILNATIAIFAIIAFSAIVYAYGEQILLRYQYYQVARRERLAKDKEMRERKILTAARKQQQILASQNAAARAIAEAHEREIFEQTTLAKMRAAEAQSIEFKRAAIEARQVEDLVARERDRLIDEDTRRAAAKIAEANEKRAHDWENYGSNADQGAVNGSEDDEVINDSEEDELVENVEVLRMEIELNPNERGTQVRLDSMSLSEDCVTRLNEAWILLECNRCALTSEIRLSGLFSEEADKKAWCEKCSSMLGASLRPALAHCSSGTVCQPIIGHIDTVSCSVADVPRIGLLLMCSCGGERIVESVPRGKRVRDSCPQCYKPLSVRVDNFSLVHLAGASGGAVRQAVDEDDEIEQLLKKVRKRNADQLRLAGICVGKPLPQKGACRHFKQSYRWLRFPCCGRAWPCAMCHEASDCPVASEGVWATRMICGKCSREGPYSDRPCEHCGNSYINKAGAHWQGGDGCRDQQRLSSKDSRKHKGQSANGIKKTTSAKSQRVGVKGKLATAAKKIVKSDH